MKTQILELTASGPMARDFKLRDQLRESSASAPANITEGFHYFEPAEFARFLRYAVGSLGERQQRLRDALDSRYIDQKRFAQLNNLAANARRLTTNLMLGKQRQADTQRQLYRRRRPKPPQRE